MSRVNGRRPPKYVQTMNYPKPVSPDEEITFPRQQRLTDKEIEALPLKSDVYVRMRDGRIVKGKLVSHSDWLVGCPVVDIGEESSVGIGYDGEIVAAAPQQEVKS
ncbi:hypothetical protein BG151_000115 [Salmonella enterica subsp. enterica serovar Apapa]|uniref:Uncharacterized protein n=1 Tax=Salmonella enterica subsp. enterica serovar Lattenkamp TaxID=2564671 RepID=A0A734G8B4_SALET|nr:hypothetical protein [Salmonella enterica]EAW1938806.1 hypothetical protein [Salmonella enterica subsp. enterica]EBZ6489926.1 hypothetical protein [Salmonella enterica subsp. enterica serovar Dugbe]EDH5507003.1 hypothetical protein [Salmonella enterica subsp. enterica serovar Apapa]EEJ2514036.1 hypothetical protein [Salmonella enterica subsp. enterica serovar California]EKQ9731112.1 hypothetical protein [Salmonella enterica subsp. enterica serovar Lattenkamp]